jgi:hypothetical protein
MKVYLAGPMRGYPLYNFAAFFSAAIDLRTMGHIVSNPAELDMAKGLDPSLELDDPKQAPFNMEEVLRQDFIEVLYADAIVLLPGWEESSGARDEAHIAMRSGRQVLLYRGIGFDLEPYTPASPTEILLPDDKPRLWSSLPGVKAVRLTLTDSTVGAAQVRLDIVDSESGEMLYDFEPVTLEDTNHHVEIKLDAEVEVEPMPELDPKHGKVLDKMSSGVSAPMVPEVELEETFEEAAQAVAEEYEPVLRRLADND